MGAPDLTALAFALGSASAAERFRDPALARAAGLSGVASAWNSYRRDAGAGPLGPAHLTAGDADIVQATSDPRRDAILLWLADHAVRPMTDAARTIATMVGATRRFDAEERALLDVALDALDEGQRPRTGPLARAFDLSAIDEDHPLSVFRPVIAAIDRLSGDAGFVEAQGGESELRLPGGTLRRYVAAEPAGAWALNLALLARPPRGLPVLSGIVPRAVFRLDLEADERVAMLTQRWTMSAQDAVRDQHRLSRRLLRGEEALVGLSRNARAGEAWALIAALGPVTRAQIVRALGLSRAGGDIQARALADAGLVSLDRGGQVRPVSARKQMPVAEPLDHWPLSAAAAAVDESMAAIDRLLARSAR